jgi:hypothetical protein
MERVPVGAKLPSYGSISIALRFVRHFHPTDPNKKQRFAVPRSKNRPKKRKEPPGNRAALSSGRIVPTEAKPSKLSGCIVGVWGRRVKRKSGRK